MKYRQYILYALLGAFFIGIDQYIKSIIVSYHALQYVTYYIHPFLGITHMLNTGISFSFFADGGVYGQWILISITSIIVAYLVYWFYKTHNRISRVGLTLIMSGAIGNIIDRIQHGGVVDFISVKYNSYYFPVFNSADTFIFIGCVIVFLQDIFAKKQ